MDLFFSIAAGILLVLGFLGTFLPVLPGAPLAWAGLLLAYFSEYNDISLFWLIVTAIAAAIVSVIDNILPITMTKKYGGSKTAMTGSTIGLIIGFFAGPVGIIIGPFLGSLIFELFHTNWNWSASFNSALGAFMGFLAGTGIKMASVIWFILLYIFSFF